MRWSPAGPRDFTRRSTVVSWLHKSRGWIAADHPWDTVSTSDQTFRSICAFLFHLGGPGYPQEQDFGFLLFFLSVSKICCLKLAPEGWPLFEFCFCYFLHVISSAKGSFCTASLEAQLVKNLHAVREIWVWSLGWKDPLEKGKATSSSILAWRIPWAVYSMGLHTSWDCRVGKRIQSTHRSCIWELLLPPMATRHSISSCPALRTGETWAFPRASLIAQLGNNPPAMQETLLLFLPKYCVPVTGKCGGKCRTDTSGPSVIPSAPYPSPRITPIPAKVLCQGSCPRQVKFLLRREAWN